MMTPNWIALLAVGAVVTVPAINAQDTDYSTAQWLDGVWTLNEGASEFGVMPMSPERTDSIALRDGQIVWTIWSPDLSGGAAAFELQIGGRSTYTVGGQSFNTLTRIEGNGTLVFTSTIATNMGDVDAIERLERMGNRQMTMNRQLTMPASIGGTVVLQTLVFDRLR